MLNPKAWILMLVVVSVSMADQQQGDQPRFEKQDLTTEQPLNIDDGPKQRPGDLHRPKLVASSLTGKQPAAVQVLEPESSSKTSGPSPPSETAPSSLLSSVPLTVFNTSTSSSSSSSTAAPVPAPASSRFSSKTSGPSAPSDSVSELKPANIQAATVKPVSASTQSSSARSTPGPAPVSGPSSSETSGPSPPSDSVSELKPANIQAVTVTPAPASTLTPYTRSTAASAPGSVYSSLSEASGPSAPSDSASELTPKNIQAVTVKPEFASTETPNAPFTLNPVFVSDLSSSETSGPSAPSDSASELTPKNIQAQTPSVLAPAQSPSRGTVLRLSTTSAPSTFSSFTLPTPAPASVSAHSQSETSGLYTPSDSAFGLTSSLSPSQLPAVVAPAKSPSRGTVLRTATTSAPSFISVPATAPSLVPSLSLSPLTSVSDAPASSIQAQSPSLPSVSAVPVSAPASSSSIASISPELTSSSVASPRSSPVAAAYNHVSIDSTEDDGQFPDGPEANYAFQYSIKDEENNDYGHQQSRDESGTSGRYYVNLPDGRFLSVTYTADKTGFNPKVEFIGEAQYPEDNSTLRPEVPQQVLRRRVPAQSASSPALVVKT